MHRFIRNFIIVAILAGLLLGGRVWTAQAQETGGEWSEPINLSKSGAASDPVVVDGPRGTLQAIWWDAFDGLTTSIFDGKTWSDPVIAPIITFTEDGDAIWIVWDQKPLIISDNAGLVHAFWTDTGDPYRPGIRRLLHSQLRIGTTNWSAPRVEAREVLAYTAVRDPADGLILIYIRNEQSAQLPAGIYFNYVSGSSTARLIYPTRYFRGVKPEDVHMHLLMDDQGIIYFAWDDPRLQKVLFTTSPDKGKTWTEARVIGDDIEDTAQHPHILDGPGTQTLLIWEDRRATCALYQQVSADGGATWSERTRILEGLRTCPQQIDTLRTTEGQVLLVGGVGSNQLILAAWDGTRWSEPKTLSFSFDDPVVKRRVTLDKLRAILVNDTLAVSGFGQDGEVWFQQAQVSAMAWAFAPPLPWSNPVNVSQGEVTPGLPAMTVDNAGRVHVLWAEQKETPGTALYYARNEGAADPTRWTRPARVLSSATIAHQPDIVVVGDRLHAVWSGGTNGGIFYSRAYVRDAYVSGGWSTAIPLSSGNATGSWPRIVADLGGTLHVVYAVPLNEGRGLYYTRSDDAGETWSPPQLILDAAARGWAQVDHPTLAVDAQRTLHVACMRQSLPGAGLPAEILYIRSGDEGKTWSEPVSLATDAADWPQLATTYTGEVHILWQEVTGARGWYHRWSANNGADWAMRARLRSFESIEGPVRVAVDGTGALHVAALGYDDAQQPALLYSVWHAQRWSDVEMLRMAPGFVNEAGVAVAAQPLLGQLSVVFRGRLTNTRGVMQTDIYATQREIAAVEVLPTPAFTPPPTATPTPTPTPQPTPTPRPTVNIAPPPAGQQTVTIGPVTLPVYAIGGILGAAILVILAILLMGRRRR
ncbi:MAG TPA: sialidase family protein [Anaerolineae bacterium]|nr:sialidase family protein [Anaerolineae bacterium]HQK13189.1 sialidase family protein [Anaerolineae bacterium]